MSKDNKTVRKDRRAPGKVGVDDRGNSVWDWNPRTEAHALDDTNALLEQLDNDTLALVDTHGIEVTSRLQKIRDEFDIYKQAQPQDDGSGLYPRERIPRRVEAQQTAAKPDPTAGSMEMNAEEGSDDAGADPYNQGTRKGR